MSHESFPKNQDLRVLIHCFTIIFGLNFLSNVNTRKVKENLCEAQNLATQVEGVAEAGLLALLGGERLDGLEVEVVVEVQVVEVLAVDEQVEHVVALPTHL